MPALERRRMGHVEHTYLRAGNYAAANPHLVANISDVLDVLGPDLTGAGR